MVSPKINEKLKARITKEQCNTWYNTIKYKFSKFINKGPVAKFICFIIIWIAVAIPAMPYYLLTWVFSPTEFWKKLAVFICWAALFGWLQAIAFVFGIVLTANLLLEDKW